MRTFACRSTFLYAHMAYEVLFTIWQRGQLAIPVRTTLAKVKTILGADYTLAMLSERQKFLAFVFLC